MKENEVRETQDVVVADDGAFLNWMQNIENEAIADIEEKLTAGGIEIKE